MPDLTNLPVFALMVKYRHEKSVARALEGKGFKPYIPLQRLTRRYNGHLHVVEMPLFPTYVFARFDPLFRLPILTIPGVFRIVGNASGPLPVDEEEFESIRLLCLSEFAAEPFAYCEQGDRMVVMEGPLAGVVGVLVTIKNSHKLVLSMTILQRSVAVEIDTANVRPLHHRAPRHLPGPALASARCTP